MKNKLFYVLFSLITTAASAQQGINYGGGTSTKLDYTLLNLNDSDSQIKGSKYLTDNFVRAQISGYNDKVFAIRYDIFNDQMEFQGGDNQIYVINKDNIFREILFLDSKDTYRIFDYIGNEGGIKAGYFSILYSLGGYTILKKNKVVFIDKKESSTGYDAPRPATYKKTKDRHYIIFDDDPAVLINTNKKRFSSIFSGKEKEVLSFIKKNKINLSNDLDLIELVRFLNSK